MGDTPPANPPIGDSPASPENDTTAPWYFWVGLFVIVCLFIYAIWFFVFRKVARVPTAPTVSAAPKLSTVPISGSGLPVATAPPVVKVPNVIGCYADKTPRAMPVWVHGENKNVYVSFDKCKQDTINGGWKYYSLQDGKLVNGQYVGVCFASNDLVSSQQYGKSGSCNPVIGTDKHAGNAWTNYIYGTDDIEPTGKEAPVPVSAAPVGCYRDQGWQAMPEWVLGNTNVTYDDCRLGAAYKGLKYFGLQNVGSDGKGVCFGTTNDTLPTKFGTSTNCQLLPGSDKQGGKNDTNFVYKLS